MLSDLRKEISFYVLKHSSDLLKILQAEFQILLDL